MPQGQPRSIQERLDAVTARIKERDEKHSTRQAKDRETQARLQEEIVRERVVAEYERELDEKVAAELAALRGETVPVADPETSEVFSHA